jgi:hypothetical protein
VDNSVDESVDEMWINMEGSGASVHIKIYIWLHPYTSGRI